MRFVSPSCEKCASLTFVQACLCAWVVWPLHRCRCYLDQFWCWGSPLMGIVGLSIASASLPVDLASIRGVVVVISMSLYPEC